MAFLRIDENIIFDNKDDLIFTHFYLQTRKKNIETSPKDISLLVELYKQGGYNNKEEQEIFFKTNFRGTRISKGDFGKTPGLS